jgi:hypothetical protein
MSQWLRKNQQQQYGMNAVNDDDELVLSLSPSSSSLSATKTSTAATMKNLTMLVPFGQ